MASSGTVLIVDDDPIGRLALETLFKNEGYAILSASGGEEALTLARQQPPQVVLLDVLMPDLDGYQVCAELRAQSTTADATIYLVTSLDDPETTRKGKAAGANRVLTKPFSFSDLRNEISHQLQSGAAGL